jgi:hypothetical protein
VKGGSRKTAANDESQPDDHLFKEMSDPSGTAAVRPDDRKPQRSLGV